MSLEIIIVVVLAFKIYFSWNCIILTYSYLLFGDYFQGYHFKIETFGESFVLLYSDCHLTKCHGANCHLANCHCYHFNRKSFSSACYCIVWSSFSKLPFGKSSHLEINPFVIWRVFIFLLVVNVLSYCHLANCRRGNVNYDPRRILLKSLLPR